MQPTKSKELIPIVAKQLGISNKIAEDIVNFYWKEVWNNLTNPTEIKVHVACFGDFDVKHWKLEKEIEINNKKIKFNPKRDKQGVAVYKDITNKSEILSNLLYKVQEEKQRKEFIYNHKKNEKEINSDLGE